MTGRAKNAALRIACVGASGAALPPGLIYSAESKTVQEAWVRDVDKRNHHIYVTVTSSGWSDNDAGLVWLQQVFDVLAMTRKIVQSVGFRAPWPYQLGLHPFS